MKVVIGTSVYGTDFVDRLSAEFPGVEFTLSLSEDEQRREAADADVFYGWPSRESFLGSERLRWIACPGTGIDEILAVPEIAASDIPITNAPGAHVTPMADHTVGMMLALAHNFRNLYRDQEQKLWNVRKWDGRMHELRGRTIGIYGYGALGRAIADRLKPFGARLVALDPFPGELGAVDEMFGADRIDEFVAGSDWLVVTAPLTDDTAKAIDRRRIWSMRPGSWIVVISRGGIVDEDALCEALSDGHIAGAGIDAAEIEPLPPESPLWDQWNVIITQHASALSPEMFEGRRLTFIENLRRFLDGEPLKYLCDRTRGY